MKLYERLRQVRKESGRTQKEVSASTGIAQSNLSDAETYMEDALLSTLKTLAKCYGMSVAELLKGVE